MNRRPACAHVTGWDRAAVIALGAVGCALSYSALQQMAVAIHVRPSLCWLFPLAIDGFIAYGVRALLVLRAAPLRARLYVWTLFGTATAVSVWANALHAVRLNRAAASVTALRLGDRAVAALSTVAPLALAGAVHLYIIIARGPDSVSQSNDTAPAVRTSGVRPGGARRASVVVRTGVSEPGQHVAPAPDAATPYPRTATGSTVSATDDGGAARSSEPSGRRATVLTGGSSAASRTRTATLRPREPDTDRLLAIAQKAVLTEGKLTRKVIAQAIRGQGIPLSNDTLTGVMAQVRAQSGHPD